MIIYNYMKCFFWCPKIDITRTAAYTYYNNNNYDSACNNYAHAEIKTQLNELYSVNMAHPKHITLKKDVLFLHTSLG